MGEVPVVYIAGDWKAPPIDLCARLEDTGGCVVSPKWWEDKVKRSGNIDLLLEEVRACDVFILDMRGPRHGTHYYAGSHLGLGMAKGASKEIHVIPGTNETRVEEPTGTYTSCVATYVTDEKSVVERFER